MNEYAKHYLKDRLQRLRRHLNTLFKNFKILLGLHKYPLFATEEQIKKLRPQRHKKLRALFVSILIPGLFALLKLNLLDNVDKLWVWILVSLVMSVVVYVLTLWVLYFHVTIKTAFGVVLLPAVFTFVYTWFLSYLFILPIVRVSLIFSFGIFLLAFIALLYIVLLTTNILNVNQFFKIPLAALGESFLLFFEVLILSIWTFLLYRFVYDITNTLDMTKISFRIFFLLLFPFWFFVLVAVFWVFFAYFFEGVKTNIQRSTYLALIFLFVTLFLILFVPNAYKISIFTALWGYLILSHLLHSFHKTFNFEVWLEFVSVIFITALLVL